MGNTIKLLVIVIVAIVLVAGGALVAGRYLSQDSMTAADLRSDNTRLAKVVATAQADVTNLKQVNARLQADVAGGRTVEEERQVLKTRSDELDRREQNIAELEKELAARDAKLRQSEQEFYEATNLTQQEIGQAKQVQTEYEGMRQARDEAQMLANRWLMFIWGVSILAFVLLLAIVVLVMRYWTAISRNRVEAEHRRQVAQLLSATLATSMSAGQKATIVSAVSQLAGLPTDGTPTMLDEEQVQ